MTYEGGNDLPVQIERDLAGEHDTHVDSKPVRLPRARQPGGPRRSLDERTHARIHHVFDCAQPGGRCCRCSLLEQVLLEVVNVRPWLERAALLPILLEHVIDVALGAPEFPRDAPDRPLLAPQVDDPGV